MTKTIHDLDTPALLVDLERLESNLRDMQETANGAGVGLRPHIKTHKCLEIAKKQMALGAVGLTCAKISEAEAMSWVCSDLFIAYPIVGEIKLDRLDRLNDRAKTRVSVECEAGAEMLETHLAKVGRDQDVMIKIETGLKRTGQEVSDLKQFLEFLAGKKHIRPMGIFTHEGKAYGLHGEEEIRPLLQNISEKMAEAATIFEEVTGKRPLVSPGCTLTARLVREGLGFDEIRPGTYVFKDTYCVESGIYRPEECALSVLVQIVSVKSDGRVVVDGGSKTFALDRHKEMGHGRVHAHPDLMFDRLSEEHGVFVTDRPEKYQVGQRLEVITTHVCPVVNLHNHLVVRKGEEVVDVWDVDARGCVR
ncbi:MAG: alanine racemase [Candidatus Omnitrophica bacterium]|nr:alanine racemase [Candidatus Omnitrophota bacterium]